MIFAHYDPTLNTTIPEGGDVVGITDYVNGAGNISIGPGTATLTEELNGLWGWQFTGSEAFSDDKPVLETDNQDIMFVMKQGTAVGYQGAVSVQTDGQSTGSNEAGVICRFENTKLQVLISAGDSFSTHTSEDGLFPSGWEGLIHVRFVDGVLECRANGELLSMTQSGAALPAAIDYDTANTPRTVIGGISSGGAAITQFTGIIGDVVIGPMNEAEYKYWTEQLLEKWGFSKRLELFISEAHQSSSTVAKTVVPMIKNTTETAFLHNFPRDDWDVEIHFPHVIKRGNRLNLFYAGLNVTAARWGPCYAYSDDNGRTWVKPNLGRHDILAVGNTNNNVMFLLPRGGQFIGNLHFWWDDQGQQYVFMVRENTTAGDQDAAGYIGTMKDPLKDVSIRKFVAGRGEFNSTGTGTGSQPFEPKSLIRFASGRWGMIYTHDHTANRRSLGIYKTIGTDFLGTWYDAGAYAISVSTNNQFYAAMPSQVQHHGGVLVGTENMFETTTHKLGPLRPWVVADGHTLEVLEQPWLALGDEGDFDENFIMHASFEDCGDGGDKLRLYYAGAPIDHASYPRGTKIGLANLVKNRYVSATDGVFVSKTMPLTSNSILTLNLDSRLSSAGVTYELLDATGVVIENYEAANCIPLKTENANAVLGWTTAASLPNKNCSLRLVIPVDAEVYSYTFDRNELPVTEETFEGDWWTNSDAGDWWLQFPK